MQYHALSFCSNELDRVAGRILSASQTLKRKKLQSGLSVFVHSVVAKYKLPLSQTLNKRIGTFGSNAPFEEFLNDLTSVRD